MTTLFIATAASFCLAIVVATYLGIKQGEARAEQMLNDYKPVAPAKIERGQKLVEVYEVHGIGRQKEPTSADILNQYLQDGWRVAHVTKMNNSVQYIIEKTTFETES